LEFDALPTYSVAIAGLGRADFRDTLRRSRAEHERHVQDLSAEIRALGGTPLTLPHLPTGMLKLGLQAAALPGGDASILLAFAANEWQSREKYARYAAQPSPPQLDALLRRHAEDEARHYAWACRALEGLGWGEDTLLGQAHRAFRARCLGAESVVILAARG
jgi:rubrerythrin